MRKDFENFKNEHASVMKEIFAIPSKDSPTIDDPKSSNEDINVCLACPRLQLDNPSKRRFKKDN